MKARLVPFGILWVVILLGCSPDERRAEWRLETETLGALKQAMIEYRLTMLETNITISDVSALRKQLEKKGSLAPFEVFGQSNLFFNPNLKLWLSDTHENHEVAMCVRANTGTYLFVRFDESIGKAPQSPVAWTEASASGSSPPK